MSIIGKILIILNLIFAIAYAAISAVLYAQRVDDRVIVQKMERERDTFVEFMKAGKYRNPADVKVMEGRSTEEGIPNYIGVVKNVNDEITSVGKKLNDEIGSLQKQIDEKAQTANQVKVDLQDARSKARIAEDEARDARAKLSGAESSWQKASERAEQLEKLKKDAEEDSKKAQQKYEEEYVLRVEAQEKAKRFDEELALAKEDIKRLQSQVDRLKSMIERAMRQGCPFTEDSSTSTGGGGGVAGAKIRGQVLGVKEALKLVIIDKGMADGVRTGMEFIVHRGADFVGRIEVEKVYDECSTGRVTVRRLEMRQGDHVTTSLE